MDLGAARCLDHPSAGTAQAAQLPAQHQWQLWSETGCHTLPDAAVSILWQQGAAPAKGGPSLACSTPQLCPRRPPGPHRHSGEEADKSQSVPTCAATHADGACRFPSTSCQREPCAYCIALRVPSYPDHKETKQS